MLGLRRPRARDRCSGLRVAFEVISLAAEGRVDQDTDWFLTWAALIPPACEGRDAVGFAPSVPSGEGRPSISTTWHIAVLSRMRICPQVCTSPPRHSDHPSRPGI